MSEYVIANKEDIVDIADAIREKTGKDEKLLLSSMPNLISGIEGGSEILNFFQGSKFKIGYDTNYSNSFTIPIIDNLSSIDDIKLVAIISSNYLEGVSLTIPENNSDYTVLYLGVSINGLQTETYIYSDNSRESCNGWDDFSIDSRDMTLNTPQSRIFNGTYYYLIIYNETQSE